MKKHHQQRLAKLAVTFLDRLELHVGEPSCYALRVDEDREMWFDMKNLCIMEDGRSALPSQVVSCGTSCCLLGFSPAAFPEEFADFQMWSEPSRYLIGDSDGWKWDFLFSERWSSDPLFAATRCLGLLRYEYQIEYLFESGWADDYRDEEIWGVEALDQVNENLTAIYKEGKTAIKIELEKYL